MSEGEEGWKKLHPASLLVNLVPMAWRTLRVGWPLLLALTVGGGVQGLVDLTIFALFGATAVGRTVTHFLTLRYRVAAGRLHIRSGLFGRSDRVIDPARIQNMELVQNLFHKLAGLVELRIETAGDSGVPGGAEGLLSALSLAEAEELRRRLGRTGAHVEASPAPADAIDAPNLVEVVGYGVSVGRVGAVAIAFGLFLEGAGQFPALGLGGPAEVGTSAAIGLVLVALAGGYALSVGNAVLRFYNHRWWRRGDSLHFESGLLTRRRMDIPLSKVQLLRISAPILRRWMGYCTLLLETAAVGVPATAGGATEGIVPMVPGDEVQPRVQACFPAIDVDASGRLSPCAPAAVRRAAFFGALRWAGLAALVSFGLGATWAWALLPWGALVGFLDARWQGWALSPGFIVVRRGYLRRDTWVLPRAKVQSVHWLQSPSLRASGLARVVVWLPGGRLALPDLRTGDARAVYDELVRASATARPGAASPR